MADTNPAAAVPAAQVDGVANPGARDPARRLFRQAESDRLLAETILA